MLQKASEQFLGFRNFHHFFMKIWFFCQNQRKWVWNHGLCVLKPAKRILRRILPSMGRFGHGLSKRDSQKNRFYAKKHAFQKEVHRGTSRYYFHKNQKNSKVWDVFKKLVRLEILLNELFKVFELFFNCSIHFWEKSQIFFKFLKKSMQICHSR